MKRILLVDGMALLFRGFFATAHRGHFMRNDEGVPTNGVYQFLRYFLDGYQTFQPTHMIVCWDMGKRTFRNEIYKPYKQNRPAPPEELIPQFDLVKEAVDSFGLPNIGIENYEADDLIGSIATRLNDSEVLIQTGDRDLLQLVDTNVSVLIMKKGIGNYERYTVDNFYEKTQLQPDQIIDFKGLTGDTADNYPGVYGIGEKTAIRLLKQYGSFPNLLKHVDKLTPGIRNKITDNIEMFYTSQKLATIKRDLAIHISLDDARVRFDREVIQRELGRLGIRFSIENYVS